FQGFGYPGVRRLITLTESPPQPSQPNDKADPLVLLCSTVDGPQAPICIWVGRDETGDGALDARDVRIMLGMTGVPGVLLLLETTAMGRRISRCQSRVRGQFNANGKPILLGGRWVLQLPSRRNLPHVASKIAKVHAVHKRVRRVVSPDEVPARPALQ